MLSRQEKINYIRLQGIPVEEHVTDIDSLYNLAITKELASLECLGNYSESDSVCAGCYFGNETKQCQKLQVHLNKTRNHEYDATALRVSLTNSGRVEMSSLEYIIDKISYRPESKDYKVARMLLEKASNNARYSDILDEIGKIIDNLAGERQRAYFYRIRKQIEQDTGLKIEIVTTKIITLGNIK